MPRFGFDVFEFLLSMFFKVIVLFFIFIITKDAPPPKYVPFYGLIKNILTFDLDFDSSFNHVCAVSLQVREV